MSRGFTLLELLIVIIIVGVLAAVALPMLFANIENARSAEARNTIGVVRRALEACYMGTQNYSSCANWNAIGMTDPGADASSHFTYGVVVPAAPCGYTIFAMRNTLDDAGTAGAHIAFGLSNSQPFWCSEAPYNIDQNCVGTCLPY